MNIFLASAIGALFLAAALTTLTTLLWPDNWLSLLVAATVALFLNGLLAVRLAGNTTAAAAPSSSKMQGKPRGDQRPAKPTAAKRQAPKSAPAAEPAAPVEGSEEGTVKWFNRSKGFGFIVRSSGEEIFVHQRSIVRITEDGERRRPALKDGQKVRFTVADHEKGLQAENVTIA